MRDKWAKKRMRRRQRKRRKMRKWNIFKELFFTFLRSLIYLSKPFDRFKQTLFCLYIIKVWVLLKRCLGLISFLKFLLHEIRSWLSMFSCANISSLSGNLSRPVLSPSSGIAARGDPTAHELCADDSMAQFASVRALSRCDNTYRSDSGCLARSISYLL